MLSEGLGSVAALLQNPASCLPLTWRHQEATGEKPSSWELDTQWGDLDYIPD